jgi:ADP-ribose diphosphatase
MRPHGPWKIRANREAYRDPWLTVTVDDVVRPDGKEGTFSVVHIQPGVCVVAVDRDGIAYLTEEFRYAIGRPSIEGVSGGIDEGEEPLDAARRELREELGIDAARWTAMGTVDPFTSMTVSPTRLFLAEGLSFGEPRHEGTERIRRVTMLLAESVRAVLDGRITHAPTCVLLLKAALRVGTGWVEPEEQSVVRMAGPDGPRTRSRVVVIEDNYDAAESLRMLLETQGCEVAVAHTDPSASRMLAPPGWKP